jgi:phosphohistidine phosphatase
MRLHFLRHGIAEEHRLGLSDSLRKLTPEGIKEMRLVARGMKSLDLKLDAIYTSPLVRARETAQIAAEALGLEDVVQEAEALACGCGFGELADLLSRIRPEGRVLLVGHEPDFSTLVGQLIGGGSVRMRKAALACVETSMVRPGVGELLWLLSPGHLRALGSA